MMITFMAKKSKKTKNQLKTKERKIFIKGTKIPGFMANGQEIHENRNSIEEHERTEK